MGKRSRAQPGDTLLAYAEEWWATLEEDGITNDTSRSARLQQRLLNRAARSDD